ncbi:nucleoside phosphorylase [Croceivirga sp. JEA036]|uniref:nucleoside phosphorylase n=1 Tax=Croceivirga sp. JEA036 TaxID=2721162 RepID=UPI00143A5330|nr:nucleoside phosphorylase [Croceivirga sp. JEA036]NJB35704.1 nucleoside phosphorylase [Croceivirga sp. JEA036]
MPIADSELIINPDGSIYHLNLMPEDLAETIITVGDPDRVSMVSDFFDTVEIKKGKREFITHTGYYKNKRISVISTGIGTDNIDIVFNELDALVNIDFATRAIKEQKTALTIIRIGTSGGIQPHIPIDSFLVSTKAVGLDGLMHFYEHNNLNDLALEQALTSHCNWQEYGIIPYAYSAAPKTLEQFKSDTIFQGITVTNAGFYAPQGRQLRLRPQLKDFHSKLKSFQLGSDLITNLEMETAGIYGLSKLLGHNALSMNAILANRATGEFSNKPTETVAELIQYCLSQLT